MEGFEDIVERVAAGCVQDCIGEDEYTKVKYVYEWLISRCDYELNAENNQNILSVFMAKLNVRGTAELRFEADVFRIYVTIRANADTSGGALAAGKTATEQFLSLMQEKMGLSPSDFRFESERTDLRYGDAGGYQYQKSVSTELRADLAAVEQVTALLSNLANVEYHMDTALSDMSEKEQAALQAAITDSRKKAEQIAAAMGQRVVSAESVQCEMQAENAENMPRMMKACCDGAAVGLAADLGKPFKTVSKSVEITWIAE